MKLDVGCGHAYRGDVNLDLFLAPTKHRMLGLPDPDAPDDPLRHVPALFRGDGCHLPFSDNAFDETVSYHLIEHLDDPYGLLCEMVRVTKPDGLIEVETPHKLSHRRQWSLHTHSFNLRWFEHAFQRLHVQLLSADTSWRYLPHAYVPLVRLPYFIHVKGKVKK